MERFIMMEYFGSGECELSTGIVKSGEDGVQELHGNGDWVINEEMAEGEKWDNGMLEELLCSMVTLGNNFLEFQNKLEKKPNIVPDEEFVLVLYNEEGMYEINVGRVMDEMDGLETEGQWSNEEEVNNTELNQYLSALAEKGEELISALNKYESDI